MKNTFSVLFYVKKQQKKSGLLPIMGRITVNKQTTQFFTQLEIDPQTTEWDSKTIRHGTQSKERTLPIPERTVKCVNC